MRAMSLNSILTACCMTALSLSVAVGNAWAEHSGLKGQAPEPSLSGSVQSVGLRGIQKIDVLGMEPFDFSSDRQNVPPELVEFMRSAIRNEPRLPYASPADGVLRLRCEDSQCNRIRAELSQGLEGPVVWQRVEVYRKNPLFTFHFLPDSRLFANRLIEQLAQDYSQSLKPSAVKIQIKDE